MAMLGDRPRLKLGVFVGGAIALLVVGWIVAFEYPDLDAERLAQVGDAVAPIVGCLSLIAVLAALDSVRVQTDALDLQQVALDEQRVALSRELEVQRQAVKLQSDGLEAQQKALQTEITAQRHTALGAAYARLFGALEVYRAEVLDYLRWNDANRVDKEQRRARRQPLEQKYEEVRLAKWNVHFVDPDPDRERMRDEITTHHDLEPSQGDTSGTQRAHASEMRERLKRETELGHELRSHLLREMGFRQNDAPGAGQTQEA